MAIISDEIRWMISEFMDKVPKPVKMIFFILMLVGLVSLIPFMLHLFGFHCNHGSEIIQTSPLKFLTNVRLAFMGAGETINKSSYIPDRVTSDILLGVPIASCRKPICYVDGEYYYESNAECDNQTIIYPYVTTLAEWSRCGICDGDVNHTGIRLNSGGSDYHYLCFGDAYHINKSDRNWYQSWVCDEGDDCTVPTHYKYEFDTGTFDCVDLDICGTNQTETIYEVDSLLDSADGKLLYDDPNTYNYKSFIRLRCDNQLSPEITLFGTKDKGFAIFDVRIWLVLIVIYVMFIFLMHIPNH